VPRFPRLVAVAVVSSCLFSGLGLQRASAAGDTASRPKYVVRRGDTLIGIADRLNVSVGGLRSANGLKVNAIIRPGQVLHVPAQSQAPTVIAGVLPPELNTPDRQALIPLFRAAAKEAGIPTDLLMSLSYTESGWSQAARSADKAVGLGQLLPTTAKWVASTLMHEPKLDPTKPTDNLRLAAFFLRYLLRTFPSATDRALAAYFEGEYYVRKHGPSPAGRRYASKILNGRVMFSKVA
jgi:soluble lytic murein transglycosylase-like protein